MKISAFLIVGMTVTAALKPIIATPAAWRHFRAYPDLAEGQRLAKLGLWHQAKHYFTSATLRDPADFKARADLLYTEIAMRNWLSVKLQTGILLKLQPQKKAEWFLYRAIASYALRETVSAHEDAQRYLLSVEKPAIRNRARVLLATVVTPDTKSNYIVNDLLLRQVIEPDFTEPADATPTINWGPLVNFIQTDTRYAIKDETVALPLKLILSDAGKPPAEQTHLILPDAAALGYQALARGDQEAALSAFSKAPRTAQIIAQLAYIEQNLGNTKVAKKDFEEAVALSSDSSQRAIWQSQLAPLAKRFGVSSQVFVRLKQIDARLAGAQTALGLSGNYTQASARLNGNPDRPLNAIASYASGIDPKTLRVDSGSSQAAFGLSWKPFANINAHVDALRLFRVGKSSRKDWELRIGAGMGDGYGPVDGETTWLHWQTTSDIAWIGFKRRDVFAAANGRLGVGWAFADKWAITPYMGFNATLQASGGTATQLEFSPGFWLHHAIKPGISGADVRVEYRHKLAGNAANANGVAVTAAVNF